MDKGRSSRQPHTHLFAGGLQPPTIPIDLPGVRAAYAWHRRPAAVGLSILATIEEQSPDPSSVDVATPPRGLLEVSELGYGNHRATSFCCCRPAATFLVAGVLARCHQCRKFLHGNDLYMYMGELAFCSSACRYEHIVNKKLQERRRLNAAGEKKKADEVGAGRMFFT